MVKIKNSVMAKIRHQAGIRSWRLPKLSPRGKKRDLRTATRLKFHQNILYKRTFDTQWKQATTKDLSAKGARIGARLIIDTESLIIGEYIELSIKLPDRSDVLLIKGSVVWTRPVNKTTVEAGIEFEDVKTLHQRADFTHFIADKLCHLAAMYTNRFKSSPVQDLKTLKKCYEIVHTEYRKKSYCEENPKGFHYNIFSLLPEARTFTVMRKNKVYGTVSLFPDSSLGIPMEFVFPEEIAKLRANSKKIAEVGLLALNFKLLPNKRVFSLSNLERQSCLFQLYKIMFNYSHLVGGITDLVIAVHPKHEKLYQYLGLKPIGPVRKYSGACHKPALPMHIDIPEAISNASYHHGIGKFFLNNVGSPEIMVKKISWTSSSLIDFLFEHKKLWDTISQDKQAAFLKVYPDLTTYLQISGKQMTVDTK